MQAHWELCSRSRSNTKRMAHSRTSGGERFVLVMETSSQEKRSPEYLGQFIRGGRSNLIMVMDLNRGTRSEVKCAIFLRVIKSM